MDFMKTTFSAFLAIATAGLAACGGGGGGDSGVTPQGPVTPVSYSDTTRLGFTGSVSAPLSNTNLTTLYAVSGSTGGIKGLVTQDSKGAIVKFGNYSLAGDYGVQEIAGNASFALGRWSSGDESVYNSSTTATVTESLLKYANGSSYYVALNQPQTALTNFNNGALTACAETYITKPKNTNGIGDSFAKSFAVQNGNVKFDAIGNAAVEFTINVADSRSSGTTTFVTEIRWLSSVTPDTPSTYNGFNLLGLKGQVGRSSDNGFVQLGTNTPTSVVVGGIYTVKLANTASYTGSFAMVCK